MGYTHYWYQPKKLDVKKFNEFVLVCKLLKEKFDPFKSIITGYDGTLKTLPVLSKNEVLFNGIDEECYETFHIKRNDKKDTIFQYPGPSNVRRDSQKNLQQSADCWIIY